jgi:hypothetical protein
MADSLRPALNSQGSSSLSLPGTPGELLLMRSREPGRERGLAGSHASVKNDIGYIQVAFAVSERVLGLRAWC